MKHDFESNFNWKSNRSTYLGFDLSTQKLKAVQLNNSLNVLTTAEVQFDCDLREFHTSSGVTAGSNDNEYYVQPVMWVKAVDIVLNRLIKNGADLSTVVSIGGSAQQHGTVYWSEQGIQTLQSLNPNKCLHQQIDNAAFTLSNSPIWMDGSAIKQCIEMEAVVGGRSEMVSLTGSKCYPRFSGPQIRKLFQQQTELYESTKRISLVSSFLASIFIGDIAPIDYADASGMNLFDVNTKTWSKPCLNACAPDLEERLGAPVKTNSIVGCLSDYFVQRFGMFNACLVTAFTGDNPSALSGMLVENDWLIMSLGTSDTIMMTLTQPKLLEEGHILCHPTDNEHYMGLLCFRNGSLVRDAIKQSEARDSWLTFNELLDSTPRGNYGNMALHFQTKEIIPPAQGIIRWHRDCHVNCPATVKGVRQFSSPQTEIRALIEGQMLHRRATVADMGFKFDVNTKIIATGGASVNKSILQVIADVFNASVYVQKNSEAALFGAAYRAKYAAYLADCKKTLPTKGMISSYNDFIAAHKPDHVERVCEPRADSNTIYPSMLTRCQDMITVLQNMSEL